MEEVRVANEEECKEMDRKCWSPECKKTGWIDNGYGREHCLGCWIRDAKYGNEDGLIFSFKRSTFDIKKLLTNLK